MLLLGTVVAGAGACVGLFGGLLGLRLFNHLFKTSMADKQIESYGPWQRSLVIGLLTSVVTLWALSLGDKEVHKGLIGLTCLGVSFVSATLYIIGSLQIFTSFGPAILEAGELSLVITIVLTTLLCVSGVLWITLVVLGGCVLLAATVLNGMWIHRLR
jgi:hypothetical protein